MHHALRAHACEAKSGAHEATLTLFDRVRRKESPYAGHRSLWLCSTGPLMVTR